MAAAIYSPSATEANIMQDTLALAQRLLSESASGQPSLPDLLRELADAFVAEGVGLAELAGGGPTVRGWFHRKDNDCPEAWPWDREEHLLADLAPGAPARALPRAEGGVTWITGIAAGEAGYLLWADVERSEANAAEAAGLAIVAQAMGHWLGGSAPAKPRWAEQVDRAGRRQAMEIAALVTRRLAHDFGNVLTGILGFSELSLSQQVPENTALHTYLQEVHRAAQNGAQFTQQLRLFSRRQATTSASCKIGTVLADEERRLRGTWGHTVTLDIRTDAGLPPVAIDPEQLRALLAAVFENAREATAATPDARVVVTTQLVELTEADCQDFLGDVRPGPHVEVQVVDNGVGLTREVEKRVFAEPFFSTKPRRRGFGLALAYGIVAAHKGGLQLTRGPGDRGARMRLVLPLSAAPAPVGAKSRPGQPTGERILVVDDDPLILQFVCTTLERAGFRVHAAESAEAALSAYRAHNSDPFCLVLSDVIMPKTTGVDLARALLQTDPGARVLFMSGQVPGDFTDVDTTLHQFDLLQKPFRPDGLVKAVRTALERSASKRGPSPRPGEIALTARQ
jgi:signal transduction histidine kinase/CheY-like chemotaxis protein